MAWHGMAWHGMAWHGIVNIIVVYSILLCSILFHSILFYSILLYSTITYHMLYIDRQKYIYIYIMYVSPGTLPPKTVNGWEASQVLRQPGQVCLNSSQAASLVASGLCSSPKGLQIAQSRPYLHTLGPKVGIIYMEP